jgi:alpha-beta hydrolase superfamily lysophospholipase
MTAVHSMTPAHEEGPVTRSASRGPALYYFAVSPSGVPRAVVGLLHGYADYGKRYAHVADAWAGHGIATVALDMRGHGRAEGKRGYCERFEEYLDDAAELARLVGEHAQGVPAFLFGHSFGGLVASSAVIERPQPWRGLVLTDPYFGMALDVPRIKVLAGQVASRFAPWLTLPTGLRGAQMTHDAERARAYDDDPLVFKGATARWFTESVRAQNRAVGRAPSLAMPLYVAFGSEDPVAKRSRARDFFDAVGSSDKTWSDRPGCFHEVLNEPEWPALATSIAQWISSHVAPLDGAS